MKNWYSPIMMERFDRGVVMSWRENNIKNEEQGGEEDVRECRTLNRNSLLLPQSLNITNSDVTSNINYPFRYKNFLGVVVFIPITWCDVHYKVLFDLFSAELKPTAVHTPDHPSTLHTQLITLPLCGQSVNNTPDSTMHVKHSPWDATL
ncbi:hypothetical protein J6590_028952 [Homalodisca vitripennis]|nr:hypothetical protein J6590_028952 [Homalodisca vitripennis]